MHESERATKRTEAATVYTVSMAIEAGDGVEN